MDDKAHKIAEELHEEFIEELELECKNGIPIESLTIDLLRKHVEEKRYISIAPNEVMLKGVIIDTFTISTMIKVYENLGKENQERFNIVLQDPKKLINFTSRMWRWFK
jgi:hypothetical protein